MTSFRRFISSLAAVAFVVTALVGVAPSASAQDVSTFTTTTAAMTNSQTSIALTSATSVAAGSLLWIDGEVLTVPASYVAGTLNVTNIRRGSQGTRSMAHNSGAKVIVLNNEGVAGKTHLYDYDPDYKATCTRGSGQASVVPWLNKGTGTVWVCRSGGSWVGSRIAPIVDNCDQVFTP